MKVIKSVRVRKKDVRTGILDIKVTIFEDKHTFSSDDRVLIGFSNDNPIWISTRYKKSGIYKDFTDDKFIESFILTNSKLNGGEYKIIQDPWSEKAPNWRDFGNEPYYLNNGSEILIEWLNKDGKNVGGVDKSSSDGDELVYDGIQSVIKRVKITKRTSNMLVEDEFTLNDAGVFGSFGNGFKEWIGTIKDKDILNFIIEKWSTLIPNYNLSIRKTDSPINTVIPYKSPLIPLESDRIPTPTPSEMRKEEIKFILPEGVIKAKQDTVFKVYIGVVKETTNSNIEESDDEFILTSDTEGEPSDEYVEREFTGGEEETFETFIHSNESAEADHVFDSSILEAATKLENLPYIPGKYKLDLIPGTYVNNSGIKISLCQIDGKPVNVRIAEAYLDMREAAKKDGITIRIGSGFRSPYDTILTKSMGGISVTADSQKSLYDVYLRKGSPLTAAPGKSNHGNGIGLDLNSGSRTGKINTPLQTKVYTWLIKNSWRFGFLRAVSTEEWHFDYLPDIAKSGPYAKIGNKGNANLFYSDLGLDRLA